MRARHGLIACSLVALAVPLAVVEAQATWPRRALGLQGGVIYHDYYGDAAAPICGVRSGW